MTATKKAQRKNRQRKNRRKDGSKKKIRVKYRDYGCLAVYFNKNLNRSRRRTSRMSGPCHHQGVVSEPQGCRSVQNGFHEVTIMGRSFCWPN
jgi:hypothetical protein